MEFVFDALAYFPQLGLLTRGLVSVANRRPSPSRCFALFVMAWFLLAVMDQQALAQTPPTCAEILSLIQQETEQGKSSDHPDRVPPIKVLLPGQTYWVAPQAFEGSPEIQEKLNGPTQFTVVGTTSASASDAQASPSSAHAKGNIVWITSRETGKISVNQEVLLGQAYERPDYATRSPFNRGDYVVLNGSQGLSFQSARGYELTFEPGALPIMARFITVWNPKNFILNIVLHHPEEGEIRDAIEVPKGSVEPAHLGSLERALRRWDNLNAVSFSFSPDEEVRYRDAKGTMHPGRFQKTQLTEALIQTSDEKLVSIPKTQVFKNVFSQPPLPVFFKTPIENRQLPLDTSSQLVRGFLNAGARLMSLPDFQTKSAFEQLAMVTQFVGRSFKVSKAGTEAWEQGSFSHFEDLLTAGETGTLDMALLLVSLLAEAGIRSRLVAHPTDGSHTWVEADVLIDGNQETFVLEPSLYGGTVLQLSLLQRQLSQIPRMPTNQVLVDFAMHFWANPDRQFFDPHPTPGSSQEDEDPILLPFPPFGLR